MLQRLRSLVHRHSETNKLSVMYILQCRHRASNTKGLLSKPQFIESRSVTLIGLLKSANDDTTPTGFFYILKTPILPSSEAVTAYLPSGVIASVFIGMPA